MSGHELLVQALQENWNHEMDWLWLATVVTTAADRRICYEHALYINLNSEVAQRNLAVLSRDVSARTTGTWKTVAKGSA